MTVQRIYSRDGCTIPGMLSLSEIGGSGGTIDVAEKLTPAAESVSNHSIVFIAGQKQPRCCVIFLCVMRFGVVQ